MPVTYYSAKNAEAHPYGLTTKQICYICQEKPGWVSKEVNNQQKEKPSKAFCLTKEKNQEGPSKVV